jgi:hypothetical protein
VANSNWRAAVHRSILALAAAMLSGLLTEANAADYYQQRLPDGVDSLMPRYYEYRAPRAFYIDEGPVALRVQVTPNPPPVYPGQPFAAPAPAPYPPSGIVQPAAGYLPLLGAPPAYGSPVSGYGPPPATGYAGPAVAPTAVPAQPICGVFRYWRDGRCIDARGY